jgi:septal ring-binding cell division protein DamX
MPTRNLKIVKLTPIAIGVCEAYNMQFHSNQPIEESAETDLNIQFNKHKCKPLDASQPLRHEYR